MYFNRIIARSVAGLMRNSRRKENDMYQCPQCGGYNLNSHDEYLADADERENGNPPFVDHVTECPDCGYREVETEYI